VNVSVSIGVALRPDDSTGPEPSIAEADAVMTKRNEPERAARRPLSIGGSDDLVRHSWRTAPGRAYNWSSSGAKGVAESNLFLVSK